MANLIILPSKRLCENSMNNQFYFPLSFKCMQSLLLHAMMGHKAPDKPNWFKLKGQKDIPNVVFIIVEGIGFAELSILSACNESNKENHKASFESSTVTEEITPSLHKKCKKYKSYKSSCLHPIESEITQPFIKLKKRKNSEPYYGVPMEDVEITPPPLKKLKKHNTNDKSMGMSKEANMNYPELITSGLPKSSIHFPVHMEVSTPSLYNLDPVMDLFHMEMSTALKSHLIRNRLTNKLCRNRRNSQQKFHTSPSSSTSFPSTPYLSPLHSPLVSISSSHPKSIFSNPNSSCPASSFLFASYSQTPSPSISSSSHSSVTLPMEEYHEDRMNRMDLLLSLEKIMSKNFPVFTKDNEASLDPEYRHLHPQVDKVTPNSPIFGIDCEMCLTTVETEIKRELTRISVVDEQLNVIYSTFVKPYNPISEYLTHFSGVTPKDLENERTTLKDVQNHLQEILPRDCILVGHSLNNDLHALKIAHPYLIDTALIYNISGLRYILPSLKLLSKIFLKKDIQNKGMDGHDPSEDAAASLQLTLLKLRNGINFGDVVRGGSLPCSEEEFEIMQDQCRRERSNWRNGIIHYWPKKTELMRGKSESQQSYFNNQLSWEQNFNVFTMLGFYRFSSAIVYTKDCHSQFEIVRTEDHPNVECFGVEDHRTVFSTASSLISRKKIIFCHLKMSDSYNNPSKKAARKELKRLDRRLKKLHDALPQNSIIMTMFSGSHSSVPFNERSNGFVFVDVVHQDRESFFSELKLV